MQDSNLRPPACKEKPLSRTQSLQRRLLQPSLDRQNSMAGDVLQQIQSWYEIGHIPTTPTNFRQHF